MNKHKHRICTLHTQVPSSPSLVLCVVFPSWFCVSSNCTLIFGIGFFSPSFSVLTPSFSLISSSFDSFLLISSLVSSLFPISSSFSSSILFTLFCFCALVLGFIGLAYIHENTIDLRWYQLCNKTNPIKLNALVLCCNSINHSHLIK